MDLYDADADHMMVWYETSEKLADVASTQQDCLSFLCSLSGVGEWAVADDGMPVYTAQCNDETRSRWKNEGMEPLESYRPGDHTIPTSVAQHYGLGEVVVCKNAGDFLQGDIISRKLYRVSPSETDGSVIVESTLREILESDGDDDILWKSLEWRHIQVVVDEKGGQTERFNLLSAILRIKADAEMDAMTFVPYGDSFADSDFVDLNF